MPRVLHHGGPRDRGHPQRVFLATPLAGGAVGAAYAHALFDTQQALAQAGIASELEILAENCHVDDGRNRLVRDFLETECTDLVFLDADVRWHGRDLVELLGYDRDVVAGVYPLKQDEEGFPVKFLQDRPTLQAEPDGLLEVEGVPTGFLRIRRPVLETLAAASPGFKAKDDWPERRKIPLVFERVLDGDRHGGDYVFCRKWRALGGQIYVNPEMVFEHFGETFWRGSLGNHLRQRNGIVHPALAGAIEALRELPADPAPELFIELVRGWDNPWSATPELLLTLYHLAHSGSGPILETGTGVSTLILGMFAAQGRAVYSLEHDPIWAQQARVALERHGLDPGIVHYCPLESREGGLWYGALPEIPDLSLVLCDGPPRAYGRGGLFQALARQIRGATIVADDMNSPTERDLVSRWAAAHHREVHIIGTQRSFAVCRPPAVTQAA